MATRGNISNSVYTCVNDNQGTLVCSHTDIAGTRLPIGDKLVPSR